MINAASNSCLDASTMSRLSMCQVSMKEHMEDSLLECTTQDLLRYDDYNNDGHLSLHEFYTAFREFRVCVSTFRPSLSYNESFSYRKRLHCAVGRVLRPMITAIWTHRNSFWDLGRAAAEWQVHPY